LIQSRSGILPEDVANKAIASLSMETSSAKIALQIVAFFKQARTRDALSD